jgi:hypothetical protein
MALNKIRSLATLCLVLFGLISPLGCGETSSTKPAPEPNVGPAGPPAAPAGGNAPAK